MGNVCCSRLCGPSRADRLRYTDAELRDDYEFEGLLGTGSSFDSLKGSSISTTSARRAIDPAEIKRITRSKIEQIVEEQARRDAEMDKRLKEQEEALRREEEALIESKRRAANRQRPTSSSSTTEHREIISNDLRQWLNSDRLTFPEDSATSPQRRPSNSTVPVDHASSEALETEDFDKFLESVKLNSLSSSVTTTPARADANSSQQTGEKRDVLMSPSVIALMNDDELPVPPELRVALEAVSRPQNLPSV